MIGIMDSWSGMYFWGLGFSSETAGGETKIGVGVFTELLPRGSTNHLKSNRGFRKNKKFFSFL